MVMVTVMVLMFLVRCYQRVLSAYYHDLIRLLELKRQLVMAMALVMVAEVAATMTIVMT